MQALGPSSSTVVERSPTSASIHNCQPCSSRALNPPPKVVEQEETSSLAEDSVHVERGEEVEDTMAQETQEIHDVQPAPIDVTATAVQEEEQPAEEITRGGGGSGSGVFSGKREVKAPFQNRDDIRSYGIYLGNWSGRRNSQTVNDHIAADLVARNPAQVLMAQEVDAAFVDTLKAPAQSTEAKSAPFPVPSQAAPAVAGSGRNYADRPVNLEPWHVACGTEGTGSISSTLIVAARSTLAHSSTVVEWTKLFHRDYYKGGTLHLAYSRILTAQIEWKRPMHGRRAMQMMNVHFHNLVAKKEPAAVQQQQL